MLVGTSLADLVALLVSLLIGMTVHEAIHAYVGYALGDTTAAEEGRLSLNPLHHIDPFMTVLLPIVTLLLFHVPVMAARPVPFNPYRVRYHEFGAALIAAAGPISNFVLALIGAVVLHVLSSGQLGIVQDYLSIFISINVALFVFNLIPIPPLDGSRVLYAFSPEGLQDFMRSLEPIGLVIIFGLVALGGFGGILLTINEAILHFLGL